MKISARNRLPGTVKQVKHDGINSEITVALPSGHELVAVITRQSSDNLALAEGRPVVALVKSTEVIVAAGLENIRLSARNQLHGTVSAIERGAVNSVVSLDLGGGASITAGITMQSTEQLDLHPGQKAVAVFKAGSVVLGVLV